MYTPGEYRSPLAPVAKRAVGMPGTYPLSARYPSGEGSLYTDPVLRQSSKVDADPSMGTANIRPAAMERTGAAYRVRQDVFAGIAPPTEPYSPATLANVPVEQDVSKPTPDKNYPKGENNEVDGAIARSRDGQLPYLG